MITITTTSIAITSITTATAMLMTTNSADPAGAPPAMAESEAAALYRLMTWLSPSFPVGAFSYSSGIEWAVEAGDITDAASLHGWLASMLTDGAGFCDAVFLAQTHRAVAAHDDRALREIAELAAAFVPSRERQLETTTQGRAFIDIARTAWHCDGLDEVIAACGGPIVYPVAVGLVSAAHGIPLEPAMHAFLHAVVSNWISAGSRLVPLGQTDSQRVLAQLEPAVAATAKRAHRRHAGRSRQRHLSRRSRQPPPRDAIYQAVSVMMKPVLLALIGGSALATVAHAGGSLRLDEVLTAVAANPRLVMEIKAELEKNNVKVADVICGGARFGNHWKFLGGGRAAPYECEIGKRTISIEADQVYFDAKGKPLGGLDKADPNAQKRSRQVISAGTGRREDERMNGKAS